jgi:hypothetical protein
MVMPVVNVRVVAVAMAQRLVAVGVGMRLPGRVTGQVVVLVVLVMDMAMSMLQRFVFVPMLMTLRQMQPHPSCHQGGGSPKGDRWRIVHYQKRKCGSNEGCR